MNPSQIKKQLWEAVAIAQQCFQPEDYLTLPTVAQRYLQSAIAPRTPLASAVRLKMHGDLKLNSWHPFSAEQIISFPDGFIWQATVWMGGLPIRGCDRLLNNQGTMQWKLFGLLPMISTSGEDITRSAQGRMLGELMWLPSVFCRRDVSWETLNASQIIAKVTLPEDTLPVTLTVNREGRLETIQFPRWGNPDGKGYRRLNFGGILEAEETFEGYTIPSRIRGGWFFDGEVFSEEGEFFRAAIEVATYR